jgi:hypothetical protein
MSKEKETAQSPSAQLITDISGALGFDPTKGPRPNKDAFAKALEKINKERQEAAEAAAEELARNAITQAESFGKAKRAFEQAEQKFIKEFQKTMNKIRALTAGKEVPEEEESEDKS